MDIGYCSTSIYIRGLIKLGQQWFYNKFFDGVKVPNPHHLYLTSDEDIKEGDWYLYKMGEFWELMQCMDNEEAERCNTHHLIARHCRKIVATTNPDLWHIAKYDGNQNIERYNIGVIPQSLIEYFVEKQGKVDSVTVEYHEAVRKGTNDYKPRKDYIWVDNVVAEVIEKSDIIDLNKYHKIKLNQSGEIIWKPMHKGIDWEKVFEDAHTMHLQEFISYHKNKYLNH
jgi:hypothetical protein